MKPTVSLWRNILVCLMIFIYLINPVSSLVAYYKYENSLIDSSGNGLTLTGSNLLSYNTTAKLGTYSRYGNNSIAYVADNVTSPKLVFNYGNFTIAAWIKMPTSSNSVIASSSFLDDLETNLWQLRAASTTTISFRGPGVVWLTSNYTALDNQWKRIVVTRKGVGTDQCEMYINGSLTSVGTCNTNLSSNLLIVGGGGGSVFYMTGNLDEFIIDNRSWNSTDIAADYNGGLGKEYLAVSINLGYPYNSQVFANNNVTFNYTLSYPTITNLTSYLYLDGVLNATRTSNNTNNALVIINVTRINAGTHTWYINATDRLTGINYTSDVYTFSINGINENLHIFNSTTYVGMLEGFTGNFSLATGFIANNSYLYYNGTKYNVTLINTISNNTLIYSSITIPNVIGNMSFFWRLDFTNGLTANTSTYYQFVYNTSGISVGTSCPANTNTAYKFVFKDEQTFNNLTINAYYSIHYGYFNNNQYAVYDNLTNIANLYICINSSIPFYNTSSAEIQYYKDGYPIRRFYLFEGTRLTNVSVNYTLYLLDLTNSTTFSFKARNTELDIYDDNYIGLLRWYPNLNSYNLVDMTKTDSKGVGLLRVKLEDVDYRYVIYDKYGNTVRLFNPSRLSCTVLPCNYDLIVTTSSNNYNVFGNIEANISYNNNTQIFTFYWNDASQLTQSMTLKVYKETALTSNEICTISGQGFTGLISCNVSGYTGTLRANAYRTASPDTPFMSIIKFVGTKIIDIAEGKKIAPLIVFLIAIFIGLIGLMINISVGIVGILIGMVIGLALGVISYEALIGFIILGGVTLWFLHRN